MSVYQHRYRNLRDLMKRSGKGPSGFADFIGMTRQQMTHIGGERPVRNIGDRLARSLEAKLSLPIGALDRDPEAPIAVDMDEYTVEVPLLNTHGSMGPGAVMPWQEEVAQRIRLSKQWIRANVTASSFGQLALITGKGDSMAPTFFDGSILLVDTGVTTIKVDAVYVLAREDELFIKRVQRNIDGSFVIKSDNPLYSPQVIPAPERAGLLVLGRVLIAWNGNKL